MLTTLVTHFSSKILTLWPALALPLLAKKENDILSTWAGRPQFNIDDDADKHHYDK